VASVGLSYEFAKNFYGIGTVSYLPLKTTATITLKNQAGDTLAVNRTDIKINPLVFGLSVGYRF
jgi:outer membrane protein